MGVALEWTEGMSAQEKEEFQALLLRNTILTRRLYEILKKREKALTRNETKESTFDSPNWAFKQAYNNGKVESIREILDLFRFLET